MNKAILFLTSELEGLSLDIYKKVQVEAKKRDQNVLCYCSGSFHTEKGDSADEAKLYNFINTNIIDGIILNGGAIGQFSSNNYLRDYVSNFPNIPVVSLSYPIDNATNITVDNYQGIYDLITHLIMDHNYSNIAFVKGPDGHPEADERFNAYKDALKANNISINNDLIASGDFSEEAGMKAVDVFLRNSKIKVEAIACVDDDSALGVYAALKKRGLKCPKDIAVTGFDDIITAEKLIPSLTTVAQPYDEMLSNAFDIISGGRNKDIVIPTLGIKRESCGCRDKDMLDSRSEVEVIDDFNKTLEILTKIELPITDSCRKKLLNALKEDIVDEVDFSFIDELSDLVDGLTDFSPIHSILSTFIKYSPITKRSSSVYQQANILINKISTRINSLNILEFEKTSNKMTSLLAAISQVDSEENLFKTIIDGLPTFGCNECHLIKLRHGKGKMIFSFKDGRQNETLREPFDPKILLPQSYISKRDYLILPLTASGEFYGYGVYNITQTNPETIGVLNSQISGEIHRLRLKFQLNREKLELEKRNHSIQDLLTPMIGSIKKVLKHSTDENQAMSKIKTTLDISNKDFGNTLSMLNEISEKIDNVMNSVSLINDISENINVLAINTSIQSAHAGEYGKSFKVIAKEIRKLSDSTAVNATTITTNLGESILDLKSFSDQNRSNVNTFRDFTTQITHFMDVFNNIAEQMQTLSSNSLNIIDIMES